MSSGITQSNQSQKNPGEQAQPGKVEDSVKQALESGEPSITGTQQGRHVDEVDAAAQKSMNEQMPQPEKRNVAHADKRTQQGTVGNDWESGRQQAK